MNAYAEKIAAEVIEADFRAGSRGVHHPSLEWHKAVALARAVQDYKEALRSGKLKPSDAAPESK